MFKFDIHKQSMIKSSIWCHYESYFFETNLPILFINFQSQCAQFFPRDCATSHVFHQEENVQKEIGLVLML